MGGENAGSKAFFRTEEEDDPHTLTHRYMHANTHAHAPPASRYAGALFPFWICNEFNMHDVAKQLWSMQHIQDYLPPKITGRTKLGRALQAEEALTAQQRSPLTAIWLENPPNSTFACLQATLHCWGLFGGLGGGSVGSGGDKALANVFRKSLYGIGLTSLKAVLSICSAFITGIW